MPYIIALLVIGVFSFTQPVFSQTWSDPTGTPPSQNTPAPINVSATSQAKAGGISAASFLSTGSMAAQGNLGVGMSSAPDALSVLSSGTYGNGYGKWSSIGHTFSNIPLYLTANDYGYGTVWDSGGVFLGLNNRGVSQKDAVLGWGSNATYPTNLIYKYNGSEVARMTNTGNLGLGTTNPTQKLSVVGNITGTQLCIGTDCRSSWPSVGGSGTVTSIIAGTGLTGGTITASGTIAADTAYLQRRVSGTCATGNAIRTIAADGTITCQSTASAAEADTLATVTTRGNTTTNGISVASLLTTGSAVVSGNLGVGTASPTEKLDVSGGMRMGSGNFTQNVAHGNYHVVQLPAANNGAATGDAGLYSWISEPGVSWTGAGIARNMRNSAATFPRVNTGLSGQMIRFDEGNSINFTTENSSGVRYTPVSVTGNTLCLNGDCRTAWPSAGGSGTVTSVAAGTGLTGGAITTSGTIAADTAYLQRRVSGTCDAGNAIRTIAADGTVTCQSTSASTPTIDAVLGAGSVTTYRIPNFQAGIDLGNGDSSGGASDTAGIKSWNTLNLYSSWGSATYNSAANWGIQFNPRNGNGNFKGDLAGNRVCIGADCRSSWPSATPTMLNEVKSFNSGSSASCTSGYVPTGCSGEAEKGCTTSNNITFTCTWFGDRGSKCLLFCLKLQ